MKKAPILFILMCLGFNAAMAAIDTAIVNGGWSADSTWKSNTAPGANDTLYIPFGTTVTVDCNCGTYNSMHIIIYGVLDFPGGRKINMTANGLIDIYPDGLLTGSNNGDKIIIDGNIVWTGAEGSRSGPESCSESGCGTNSTLPIELLYVRAEANAGAIQVDWGTATEINNDFFTLWRSNGSSDWTEVTQMAGAINSTNIQHYTYTDPSVEDGNTYYYRLSQTDIDGKTSFEGQPVKAKVEGSNEDDIFKVSPNPSTGMLYFQTNAMEDEVQLTLINMQGQQSRLNASSGYLDLSDYPKGIYILTQESLNGTQHAERIVLK